MLTKTRINEDVLIRLKWGQTEYKGRLISVDSYMNIQLSGTEEFIDGKSTGSLGQVLIRYVCSMSLYCGWDRGLVGFLEGGRGRAWEVWSSLS